MTELTTTSNLRLLFSREDGGRIWIGLGASPYMEDLPFPRFVLKGDFLMTHMLSLIFLVNIW